jgi:xylan 1,4-beta-xylosidase
MILNAKIAQSPSSPRIAEQQHLNTEALRTQRCRENFFYFICVEPSLLKPSVLCAPLRSLRLCVEMFICSLFSNRMSLRNSWRTWRLGDLGVKKCGLVFLLYHIASAAELKVDCAIHSGTIRPLHGANSGPSNLGETLDLTALHREIGIPFTRLHDCHWPNPDVIDIHAIFPDMKADPEKPESYDFRRSDDYVQSVLNTGAKIIYRLGESIEHTKKKYHVHPPADLDKWISVCAHIIQHYNDGWANGFKHNIQYWEIWNEPENRPAMWTGNDEQFFALFTRTAKTLKEKFPSLRIGGPAVGDSGRMDKGVYKPSKFMLSFMEACKKESTPLDFFSWHLYSNDPREAVGRSFGIREWLNANGYAQCESHFNEWNYLPGNDWGPLLKNGQGLAREKFCAEIGGPSGAAYSAYMLLAIQDCPIDIANYYAADQQGFGLFSWDGVPKKSFFAFKAFKKLLETPDRVSLSGSIPGSLIACAGASADKSSVNILVSHYKSAGEALTLNVANLPFTGAAEYELFVIDASRELKSVRREKFTGTIQLGDDLKAPSVGLISIRKTAP